jgi:hypothetical protein
VLPDFISALWTAADSAVTPAVKKPSGTASNGHRYRDKRMDEYINYLPGKGNGLTPLNMHAKYLFTPLEALIWVIGRQFFVVIFGS